MRGHRSVVVAFIGLFLACQERSHGDEKLPALGIVPENVIVAGISSGGYMAGQLHLAHSRLMGGLGIIAAGPYYCAENSLSTALGRCVKGGIPVPDLLAAARASAARGALDPLDGVRDDRVWLFHGRDDQTVSAPVLTAARDFYAALTDAAKVSYVDTVAATHGLPTRATGAGCRQFGRPYLNACDYDAAGEMLKALLGKPERRTGANGRLIEFDQLEFGDASLHANGFAYVPGRCAARAGCRLLIFFHGCDQSAEVVGDVVARGAGFNEWAESNGIVVLYPQAKATLAGPVNPLGCWDWWGYTGAAYATREGAQIKAVKAMIDRLSGSGRPLHE